MTVILLVLMLLLSFSCIQPEAKNSEADIISVSLPDGVMSKNPQIFNDSVVIYLSNDVFLKFLAPEFKLTDGATIFPQSGTLRSFYSPAYYEVTSENELWTKKYAVTAVWAEIPDETTVYAFEDVKMNALQQYHIFYEKDAEGQEKFSWASGNPGYSLTGAASSYMDYPLFQSSEGFEGNCACMTTCTTGTFGPMVGMPIAAGSLFLGSFDLAAAVATPLKATHFGMEWSAVPIKFSGKFKYSPGPEFYVKDQSQQSGVKVVPGRQDRCNIYAVFFETTSSMPYLDGENSLSLDNPNIISTAVLPEEMAKGNDTWMDFNLDFVAREGKTINQDKLTQGKYSIAIVMTSSADGAKFEGAPGSRLLVDNITIQSNVK